MDPNTQFALIDFMLITACGIAAVWVRRHNRRVDAWAAEIRRKDLAKLDAEDGQP